MKKTLIALLALSGVAGAETTPTEYDAYILKNGATGTKITELTGSRGQLWFNTDNATLSSWMIEFSIDKITTKSNTIFATDFGTAGTANERYGLGVYTWFNYSGVTLGKDNSHYTGTANLLFPTNESGNKDLPMTLRLAYDAEANTAYLYCADTNQMTKITTEQDYILRGSAVGGGSDVSGLASFWTDGGANHFTISSVTDMNTLAGNGESFATYVMTKSVPEPTTATLSLLALAGLAARRRRRG